MTRPLVAIATVAALFLGGLVGLSITAAANCAPPAAAPHPTASLTPGPSSAPAPQPSLPASTVPNSCGVGGDARQLANELVAAAGDGRLRFLEAAYREQVEAIAEGRTVPNCGIDVRVLQIVVFALRNFDSVGVSDLNRRCTGSLAGAGTASAHYRDGGGMAVDFYALNGVALEGRDAQSVRLITLLDPHMPHGSRVGQSNCGTAIALMNMTTFKDSCNHVHIDVAWARDELRF